MTLTLGRTLLKLSHRCVASGRMKGGDRHPQHKHTHAAELTTSSLRVFNPVLDARFTISDQSPLLVSFSLVVAA